MDLFPPEACTACHGSTIADGRGNRSAMKMFSFSLHGSGPELHNTGPHEFQRPRMQGEILPPREASGDFARLCSASVHAAYQSVQFCPGFFMCAIAWATEEEATSVTAAAPGSIASALG